MGIFNNNQKPKQKKWAERKPVNHQLFIPDISKQPIAEKKPEIKKVEPVKKIESKVAPVEPIKKVDPSLEFQMMYGLADIAEDVKLPAKTEKEPATVSPVENTESFLKKTVYKRVVNKKLTIILIENTAEVAALKNKVQQIVESLFDCVCIINYGETVQKSDIIDIANQTDFSILHEDSLGEKKCLFDALVELEKLVLSKYFAFEEREKERIYFDSIDVIGIGTCSDNCSTASKADAINSFYNIAIKSKVVNKYYCLTDMYFVGAAEIGFRSIGAISRSYQ